MAAASADPTAALARRERARGLAKRWTAHPALTGLRARIAALPPDVAGDGPALLDAARPLLEDIDWVRDAVRDSAAAMADDPWFEPPFRPLDHGRQLGLVLFDDRRLRISVSRVPLERIARHKAASRARRSVGFTGTVTAQRVIASGGVVLDLWEAPAAGADFVAARAGRCRRAGRLALADGMGFAIDGRREAWTVARQRGDMLFVQAVARCDDAPLAIEYDAETGAFLSASATDGAVARMQMMATLLRLMGRRDAAATIAPLAEEGPFFQRWHMLRELAALDRGAALPLLRRAADAAGHHELRAAAARTLDLLAA